jgi:dimethylhistidine N-methyltransferase
MKDHLMSAGASSNSLSVHEEFLQDVLAGLSLPQKTLPCKYLYDARGSELFDRICELDEYYPTRTELAIMESQIGSIADAIGNDCTLIEFGSGSSLKTKLLLDHLQAPFTCVPVDISGEHLAKTAEELQERYPEFEIRPLESDFSQPIDEELLPTTPTRRVVYFPGSTIGNFTNREAIRLLDQMRELAGEGGSLVVGIDLKKDISVLEAAYNDSQGVTAEFNRNLLARINDELDGDFELDQFRHEAIWNDALSRIEMHLVSECEQTVTIDGESFTFGSGETIHTENSHKYSLEMFEQMASECDLSIADVWTDPRRWFAVVHCRVESKEF